MNLDLVITGGTVYDGLSDVGCVADIGIAAGQIVAINPAEAASARARCSVASRTIDATGRAVFPGFIDSHSHSDFTWLVWPNATSKLLTGYTTDVSGNCGFGAFPLAGETLARRQAEYERFGLDIHWRSAREYFDRMADSPCGVNRVVLVGHGNLRGVTVGYGNVKPDRAQLAKMKSLLAEGLDAGAFGLSTGLIYPPGIWADSDEIAALIDVVRDHDGYYTSHIRNEHDAVLESIDEFIGVLARTKARGLVSHLKTADVTDAVHQRFARAHERGLCVQADRYPYLAGCTGLSAMVLPNWAVEGTTQQILARLIDPADRKRIADDINPRGAAFFDSVMVTSFARPGLSALAGQSLTQIGRLMGKDPLTAALDLLVEDRLEPEAVHFSMDEAEVAQTYRWPFVMVASDYSARDALTPGDMVHPRAFGTPAEFLATFVRKHKVCDLPTAAKKLATMAADMVGLRDRGRIAVGCKADLVVFDPDRIASRATYQNPRVSPVGIDYVLVNGQVAVERGSYTGALAGEMLRKS